jgi:hypothetical protein
MDAEELRKVEETLDEEAETAATKQPLASFVETLRAQTDDSLRLVVRYEGDEQEVLYRRQDVAETLDGDALDDRVQTLVLKGLGDPPEEEQLADFGSLRATLRWFDDAVVAYYPTGEWSGVVATFDGRDSPLVGGALDGLQ